MSEEQTQQPAEPQPDQVPEQSAEGAEVSDIASARAKKMSPQEQKKALQTEERMRRLINQNPKLTREQVFARIQQEDWDRLPADKKIRHLERVLGGALERITNLERFASETTGNITNLQYNDGVIMDALDTNFRTIGRTFVQLGVSLERQQELLQEMEAELAHEKEVQAAKMKADAETMKKANADAAERKRIEEGAAETTTPPADAEPGADEGAQVFGGAGEQA